MAVDVRYRNFFISRVVKNLKISPWDEEISIPDIRLIRKSLIYYYIKKQLILVPYFQQEEVEVAYFRHLGQDAHQDNKLGTLWLIVKLI